MSSIGRSPLLRLQFGRFQLVLNRAQAPVQSILCHQLGMRADLLDLPALQHHDFIGITDGGKPVGNDDRRPSHHQALQGLLDEQLGLGIHR